MTYCDEVGHTAELETWQETIDDACDQRQAAEQRHADLINELRMELIPPGDIPRVRIVRLIQKYAPSETTQPNEREQG